jgi:hypothetical protein
MTSRVFLVVGLLAGGSWLCGAARAQEVDASSHVALKTIGHVTPTGPVTTEQFVMQWDEDKGSFAKNPPNATISVLGGDGSKVEDAVVTLRSPKIEAGNLTFDVSVLEGSLSGGSGPAALFIDPGLFNYWHAPAYHGSWYARPSDLNDPGLYYNPNAIGCSSPQAQSAGYC